MEVKKTQQIAASRPPRKESSCLFSSWQSRDFVGDIKDELKKIRWTSPEELKVYTKIVVGATFIFGMGIYFMDLLIQGLLNRLALIMPLNCWLIIKVRSKMQKWYVVQVLSTHEKKVKKALEEHRELKGWPILSKQVLLPIENVSEVKKGQQKSLKRVFGQDICSSR